MRAIIPSNRAHIPGTRMVAYSHRGTLSRPFRFCLSLIVLPLCFGLSYHAVCQSTRLSMPQPQRGQVQRNAVLLWNDALLQAIENSQFEPPINARALAMVFTGIYDAWAIYRPPARPVYPSAHRSTLVSGFQNMSESINYAAYFIALDLYPSEQSLLQSVLAKQGLKIPHLGEPLTPAAQIGLEEATAVLESRHKDGSNQLGDVSPGAYSSYAIQNTALSPEYGWKPLTLSEHGILSLTQTFILTHWNQVQPFASAPLESLRSPIGPIDEKSDPRAFQNQALQLLRLSAALNDRTKSIAEYWSDGLGTVQPPGHWCQLAAFVSKRDHHTIDEDVVLFFALSNALLDAGIAAWNEKIHYRSERPVTAIRRLYRAQKVKAWRDHLLGTGVIPGEAWMPYQEGHNITPAFPEFVSGHSTFSAAAAEILRAFTGFDKFGYIAVIPAGSSRIEPNVTPHRDIRLRFATFSEAAEQAGMSRLYGGIHFERANLEGQALGRRVGRLVWERVTQLLQGKDFTPQVSKLGSGT
jgi:PAP2 superfamily